MTVPALFVQNNGVGVVTDDNYNTFVEGGALLANLRTFTGLQNMTVVMIGTNTPGDGGQGIFYWNTSSTTSDDSGATCIAPYGVLVGRWLRIISQPVNGNVANVLNIAALRALTTIIAPAVWVDGYYAGADGGEGMFWYNSSDNTSSDNGGTIIVDGAGHRWYRETQGEAYSVRQFGAKGDNSTDDTGAISACIIAAGAANPTRNVYFPTGNFVVSSTLGITVPMEIYGVWTESTIIAASATADVFDVGVENVFFHDFEIAQSGSIVRTAGAFIQLNACSSIKIFNVWFQGHAIGVGVSPLFGSILDISDCNFENAIASTGIGIIIESGDEIRLRHILMNSGASPEPTAGVNILNCGDVVMYDVNLLQHARGLLLNPNTGQTCASVWATDCFFDHCGEYGALYAPNGGAIVRSKFMGCWFSSSGIDGFASITSTGTIIGVQFVDCHVFANTANGIVLDYGSDYLISNSEICGNSQSGVVIDTNIGQVTIVGNVIGQGGGFGGNEYGIFIEPGGDAMIITDNRMIGNTTASFSSSFNGTNSFIGKSNTYNGFPTGQSYPGPGCNISDT
jgi:hypothetical protein